MKAPVQPERLYFTPMVTSECHGGVISVLNKSVDIEFGTLGKRDRSLGASLERPEDFPRSATSTVAGDDCQPAVMVLRDDAGEALGTYEVRVSHHYGKSQRPAVELAALQMFFDPIVGAAHCRSPSVSRSFAIKSSAAPNGPEARPSVSRQSALRMSSMSAPCCTANENAIAHRVH